ncbi:SDR family oxidoreductase [Roseibium marinum]|uniref:NAD(P)-dependent dehydrogenase (Short-subunit alcohol dehydrogenase family) n=1 Tax=Roseibium marinum TaxID=281252 RepID=A0A2S3V325_9HYPH|nr:SDR family oxidoreductase [Roseibium marinum]POF34069.1 NAD(P)-dependent dehydrogenase (short-subunit alcohol dehydrogenase family) [Roseibium marinum]
MSEEIVIVTGGSRGIGASVCRKLAANGRKVLVNFAQNAGAADKLVGEIRAAGGSAVAIQGDVGKEADVLNLFSEADRLGTLTGLVNNAGVVDLSRRVDEMSLERLTRMFSINVFGSFLCAREAVRRMSTRHGGKGGTIVNLGSAASKLGSPNQYVDYAAAKGAIDTMTVGLALEVAQEGIRVNAVRPGIIDTEIHASGGAPDRVAELQSRLPMKRAGSAEEVADAIVWLMSDLSSYTTGAILDVSGGRAILP